MTDETKRRPWESGTAEAEAFLRSQLSVKDVMARSGLSRNSVNAVMSGEKKVLPNTRSKFMDALAPPEPQMPLTGLAESPAPFATKGMPEGLDPGAVLDLEHQIETATRRAKGLRDMLESTVQGLRTRPTNLKAPDLTELFAALERVQLEIKLFQDLHRRT